MISMLLLLIHPAIFPTSPLQAIFVEESLTRVPQHKDEFQVVLEEAEDKGGITSAGLREEEGEGGGLK